MVKVIDVLYIFAEDVNLSTVWSEFEGVWLKVKEDLLNSLHVWTYNGIVWLIISNLAATFGETLPLCGDLDAQEFSLVLLYTFHLLDSFSEAKSAQVDPKLPRLQLSEIKDIIYKEI